MISSKRTSSGRLSGIPCFALSSYLETTVNAQARDDFREYRGLEIRTQRKAASERGISRRAQEISGDRRSVSKIFVAVQSRLSIDDGAGLPGVHSQSGSQKQGRRVGNHAVNAGHRRANEGWGRTPVGGQHPRRGEIYSLHGGQVLRQ